MTKPDLADFYSAITELQGNARETFGLFHDAAQGWIRFSQQLEELVEQSMLQGATQDQALTHTLIHGKGKTPRPERSFIGLLWARV